MKTLNIIVALLSLFIVQACSHPIMDAKESTTAIVSKNFETDANQAYYAVRWALKTSGYSITNEDLQNGTVTSSWLTTKVDSHFIAPFDRPDYGVNGAYYRLEIKIAPETGTNLTRVEITSRVKSMIPRLRSSETEEKRILSKISDYLRRPDIRVTNLGIEE